MKKLFFFISGIWISFLFFLIFRDQLNDFFGGEELTKVEQDSSDNVQETQSRQKIFDSSSPKIPLAADGPSDSLEEMVPFEPLPEISDSAKAPLVDPVESPQVVSSTEQSMKETKESNLAAKDRPNLSNPFGLMITKFERLPSRFRLVSWEGTKLVELEDLEGYNEVSKSYPRHWLEVGVPYVEWMHPSTKESFFKPPRNDDSKIRIQAISFEVRNQVLSYSNMAKPIGYLILKDFKIGGAPYEITNEMQAPLTSAYAIHCQQHVGANKFFHDLSGKKRGHRFGGWGVEYNIHSFNFPERKLVINRKDMKTKQRMRKEISAPFTSI